jgi:predicted dinucleotide-binding enzyme
MEVGGCPDNPWSVMVCGEDAAAKAVVMQLINSLGGFKAVDAGGVAESKIVELIGPMWLFTLKQKNYADASDWPAWRFGI